METTNDLRLQLLTELKEGYDKSIGELKKARGSLQSKVKQHDKRINNLSAKRNEIINMMTEEEKRLSTKTEEKQ